MNVYDLGVFLAVLGLAGAVQAQDSVGAAARQSNLRALASSLEQRDASDRIKVAEYARRAGIPVRRELAGGRVLELQRIAPGIGPVFYLTNNLVAAYTTSTNKVWPGGSAGLALDGAGMTIAEWDGGAVYAEHPDFTGRLTQVDEVTEVSGHATHIAGTLIGAGDYYLDSRGMAYAAHLDAYDWNSDSAEMVAAAAGQLVSNHSYGTAAGWINVGGTPPDNWWWIGGADPSDLEDPNFGYYDGESQLWDQIAWNAPYYLIVKAAGNDRVDFGPEEGEEYTIIDQDAEPITTSTVPRPPDCAPWGFDCLPTHSVAKNILTVGAVDDLLDGYLPLGGPQQVRMAEFSGWGPTDDGRIKPDLVGNGVFLLSAWPDPPYFPYALAAGTSMAAANVSASLLLLQQHYQDLNGPGQFLRAPTLKALAIHTADETGPGPGPDYAFGWGLLNTRTAAAVISDNGGAHQIVEDSLANGAVDTYLVNVTSPASVVTATLVWNDPPGTPPAPTLDPPDLMLVNDLDLRIARGGNHWLPWVLDPANPENPASAGDNFRDNVEQVRIDAADTCQYSVEVGHKGTLLDSLAQDYSLIISVDAPPAAGIFALQEDFADGMPAGWSVQTAQGVSWTVNDPVPEDTRLDNHTGGSGRFAMVDNNFSNWTTTSLATPVLDLSGTDGAVLRFSSYFFFDLLESINVDVSTNGGADWMQVWQIVGEIHDPARIVLDLSDSIAGEAATVLRFRYESNDSNQGNLWQIDDIELEVFDSQAQPENLPGPAIGPSPADGESGVGLEVGLAWAADAQADSHDVYFGTVPTLGPAQLQGNQAATGFDPGSLAAGTTYYWRIDEVNANGTTPGCTWNFTTQAGGSQVILSDGFE